MTPERLAGIKLILGEGMCGEAAREYLPELVAEVERLRAEIVRLRVPVEDAVARVRREEVEPLAEVKKNDDATPTRP